MVKKPSGLNFVLFCFVLKKLGTKRIYTACTQRTFSENKKNKNNVVQGWGYVLVW
jgi:hypothetical protein